jgi:hypothetical protein
MIQPALRWLSEINRHFLDTGQNHHLFGADIAR